ncbi:hypothetical protein NDU88_007618 [Pleurodeles waltl]|uniref:Uncharacterized protein n=1 Tax=Pleurodeles waltl TaxID=8319 RepID=A0AAV7VUC1_PLEWA|nr:hypothetical protein NDU88_007618 [Pleurodeles waltl]
MAKHGGVQRVLHGRLSRLETEIADLESKQLEGRDDAVLNEIRSKLTEFQEVAQTEVMYLEKYAVVQVYGKGEQLGATLAALLHPNARPM